jgi:AAA15 family ATPase/GTPase
VTTHESAVLDQDIVRKDEVWFVKKENDGASKLYSLEEFKPRFDVDIRKGYLSGRFGAIPFIHGQLDIQSLSEN